MKTLLIAAMTTAGILASLPAGAQTTQTTKTTVTKTTTGPAATGSITIAPEKRTIIHKQLGTTKPVTVKEKVTVGWTVPKDVTIQPVPDTIVADVPTVKGYDYFTYDNQVVLVDPTSRKVVTIIQ